MTCTCPEYGTQIRKNEPALRLAIARAYDRRDPGMLRLAQETARQNAFGAILNEPASAVFAAMAKENDDA